MGKNNDPTLTEVNYFSREMSMKYFGVSQFKNFMDCEARTMAEIKGEYEQEKSTALIVGSYIDAFFEGNLDLFIAQHPEIIAKTGKNKGGLKSDYIQANEIIKLLKKDEEYMKYMSGTPQVIMTGELFGELWKIKIDSYHEGRLIVDGKVMKDFKPKWKNGFGKLNFIDFYGYDIQGAVYQAIEGNKLPFVIAAATKEEVTDKGIFEVCQDELDTALSIVEEHLPRFAAIKRGEIEPEGCGVCPYCKARKKLSGAINYKEIDWGRYND